jgi:ankyrin repeat protein
MAAIHRGPQIVSLLLKNGANCNRPDDRSPLAQAVRIGSYQVVDLLLENGANPNPKEKYAGTPLRAAAVTGSVHSVQSLMKHGADLNEEYPLMEALRRENFAIAKSFIEGGTGVNTAQPFTVEDGLPFWLWYRYTTRAIAETICSSPPHKINSCCLRAIKKPDSSKDRVIWKDTPLWIASATGCESVRLLLNKKVDIDEPGVVI